jgi:hypothetical protein
MGEDKNWFSVHTQYNVENADQLFELINFLINEAQEEHSNEDTSLAREMLENIGVRCAKAS